MKPNPYFSSRSNIYYQVPEFPAVSSLAIAKALTTLADQPTTIMFHAEMTPPITASVGDEVQSSEPPLAPSGPLTSYSTFLSSRPPSFETYAISEIISLAHLAPSLSLHIVHLSALETIPVLRAARSAGVKITAETCPHYLTLSSETIPEGDTRHKCCPPIRNLSNQSALWSELLHPPQNDSVIKTIVSDHSPCTPDLKLLPPTIKNHTHTNNPNPNLAPNKASGNFFESWGGISSVGLTLPLLFTALTARYPHLPLSKLLSLIINWTATATASQVGLAHQKGQLAPGLDGDVVVFDPDEQWTLGVERMWFRNKCSPYQGWRFRGGVRETWLRGGRVFAREGGFGVGADKPRGRLLLEPRTV